MYERSPLEHAADLLEHEAMLRQPDPESLLALAKPGYSGSVRLPASTKGPFDCLQRAVAIVTGRRVSQADAVRWLVLFALQDRRGFLDFCAKARGKSGGGPAAS